ncbi:MAG: S41 family peptidase, partial [Hyphomicrobiaceae bacterium]
VNTIENRFVNTDKLKEINWRTRAETAWPDVAKAKSATEAAPRLNALLAELKTSHTQVFTPDEPEFYILADVFGQSSAVPEVWGGPVVMPSIGVFTAKFDSRDHITHVLEGSPADKAGLKIGDEIVSIDSAIYKPVASFRAKVGTTVAVEIRRMKDGPTSKIDVPVVMMQPTVAFERATSNSARIIERNGKRIGYVHFWQMRDGDTFKNALEQIDGSRQQSRRQRNQNDPTAALDALIIDNRVKIGGQANAGRTVIDLVANPRGGTAQYHGRDKSRPSQPMRSFAGRSTMLIDHGTRSAAEMFAFYYRYEKLGPLIGTTTAGAVTAANAETLPGGLIMTVGVTNITIDGQRLEGTGVKPDIEIARPIPYSNGADPVLDAAIEHLAKQ